MICFIVCFGFTTMSQPVTMTEFCSVWQELVQNELRLTRTEIDALRKKTKKDIASIKRFARKHCQ